MTSSETSLAELAARFRCIRGTTEALSGPLSEEDCVVQSMPDASPVKWHLAHTSWFFESFVLAELSHFQPFHPRYGFLFNSYYEALGARHPRPARGLLTRPSLAEVRAYRESVNERLLEQLAKPGAELRRLMGVIELGLQHEQQHQELLLTDLKHLFGSNPLRPAYHDLEPPAVRAATATAWHPVDAGLRSIGHSGAGFCFDNEAPAHRVFIEGHALSNRLVTNGEYLEFMLDGGYTRPELWLSDGFRACAERGWSAPLYWEVEQGQIYTLAGLRPLAPQEPVCHVSYYEADAFARWSGARLPTEAEWETSASQRPLVGNFQESGQFQPLAQESADSLPAQMFGDVWEWTGSAYSAFPGYLPTPGALGEYNAKFMCNQMVLRGGSCVTPQSHVRSTYRNFFPPEARWQFSGLRLARSA